MNTISDVANTISDGDISGLASHHTGLFLKCIEPKGKKFFDGECIPEIASVQTLFTEADDDKYPHAWRGAIICFALGLAFMVRPRNCAWRRKFSSPLIFNNLLVSKLTFTQ